MIFKQQKNIVIVGGNAAGPAAAAKAKRTDANANVILFEAGEFISTGSCELPYVLSKVINDYEKIVFFTPQKFEQEKGVKVFNKHKVEWINTSAKTISVRNLVSNHLIDFPYDKLILATGSRAIKLNLFPLETKNVFTFKTVSDLLAIQKFIASTKAKKVLLIGSGYIGLELTEAFHSLGLSVIMIDKEILPMNGFEVSVRRKILDELQAKGIEFYGGIKSPKMFFSDNEVKSIELDGWRKEIDFVVQAVGFEPNVDLARSAKINIGASGGIKVDAKMKTNDTNIYACGDCVEITNRITNRSEYFPLATYAKEFGYIAGENAAGGNAFAQPVVKNVSIKIFDNIAAAVGLSSEEAAKNKFRISTVSASARNLVSVIPNSRETFAEIIYETGTERILGANFLGGNEVTGYADLVSVLIQNKMKVSELAKINYNYTPPASPFVNVLSLIGKKLEKGKR